MFSLGSFWSKFDTIWTCTACFAVGARFAKMLAMSPPDLLPHVMAIVSASTVRETFLTDFDIIIGKDNRKKKRSKWYEIRKSMARKMRHYESFGGHYDYLESCWWAQKSGCSRSESMLEVHKLGTQLTNQVNSAMRDTKLKLNGSDLRMTDAQARILRQLILASLFDHVARKMPDGCQLSNNERKYLDNNDKSNQEDSSSFNKPMKNAYECLNVDKPVFIS